MSRGQRRSAARRLPHVPAALLAALLHGPSLLHGADLTTALPQTRYQGAPAGAATMAGGDWRRAREAPELPGSERASVLWQRRIAGGLTGNLLVDAAGRVFAPGSGRVAQFDRDGREEFTARAEFSSAVASVLLANGTRVILTKEAELLAWSERGMPLFRLDLGAGPAAAHGGLLPLPAGQLFAHVGAWVFQVDPRGSLEAFAQLPHDLSEALVVEDLPLLVGTSGDIFTWDGSSSPVARGHFGGRISAVAVRGSGHLLGVREGGDIVRWDLSSGEVTTLAHSEQLNGSPHLSVPDERAYVLAESGSVFQLESGGLSLVGELRSTSGRGELLSSSDGALALLGPQAALLLRGTRGEQSDVPEVSCDQPSSLVPAGPFRLVAGCRSGQIWMIGRPEAAGNSPGGALRLRTPFAGTTPVR